MLRLFSACLGSVFFRFDKNDPRKKTKLRKRFPLRVISWTVLPGRRSSRSKHPPSLPQGVRSLCDKIPFQIIQERRKKVYETEVRNYPSLLDWRSCLATQRFSGRAREKDHCEAVPAAVIAAFKNSYPNATIRGYAREQENGKVFYEIESRDGTTHRDVLYNPDGTVAEVEESIAAADLPLDAQQAIKQKYPRAVITLAEKTTAGDTVGFEVSLRNGRKRIAMEFDSSGKLKTKGK